MATDTDRLTTAIERLHVEGDVDPNTVLKAFKGPTIRAIWSMDHPGESTMGSGKKHLNSNVFAKQILEDINRACAKQLVETFTMPLAERVLEPANIDHGKNLHTLRVFKKRLTEQFRQETVPGYLKKYLKDDTETLKYICEALEISPSAKAATMIQNITNEVNALGLESYFMSFNVVNLQRICEEEGLEVHNSRNREVLTEAIIKHCSVELTLKDRPAPPEEPKDILKGITKAQLLHYYSAADLKEWCDEHNLVSSGKKSVLMERILGFLDGNKENVRRTASQEKKTAKKTQAKKPAAKKPAAKKAAPKKPAAKKAEPKKEEPEEDAEEEVEEEAEEEAEEKVEEVTKKPPAKATKPAETKPAETKPAAKPAETKPAEPEEEVDGLDLDHLENYDLSVLKEYCEEEGIKVKGTTKKSYMDAIIAYNDNDSESDS